MTVTTADVCYHLEQAKKAVANCDRARGENAKKGNLHQAMLHVYEATRLLWKVQGNALTDAESAILLAQAKRK